MLYAPVLFLFSLCGSVEPEIRFSTRNECYSYIAQEIVDFKKLHPNAVATGVCVRAK